MATILEDLQRAVLNSHVEQLGCRVVITALTEVNFAQLVVTLGASSIGSHAVVPVLSNNPEHVAVTLRWTGIAATTVRGGATKCMTL